MLRYALLRDILAIVVLCSLQIQSAQARRINPALYPVSETANLDPVTSAAANLDPVTSEAANLAPSGLMCRDCGLARPPVLASAASTPTATRVWQPKVSSWAAWQQISDTQRDAEYSKFVIDLKTDKIYFFDPKVFNLHVDFVLDFLQKKPRTLSNVKAYNKNYSTKKPEFILGYLTHYPQLELDKSAQAVWTFSFWEGDTITAPQVQRTYRHLQKSFTLAALKFRPDSSAQERLIAPLKSLQVPSISNNQIYRASAYQAFNEGQALGKLVIVPPTAQLEDLVFASDDIVMLQTSYPDISPVAGVITTQFSTPLSHVNLRARAWGIPNSSIKHAQRDFQALQGKWVYYAVTEGGYTLRAASKTEISAHQTSQIQRAKIQMPAADLTSTALLPLAKMRANSAQQYGTKASNLGEIIHARAPINVPDGFGVPFSYYVNFMRQQGLDKKITVMLDDARFTQDAKWRKQALNDLRTAINNAPIDAKDFAPIRLRWQQQLGGKGVFVRSSTNAEDLKGFNGAGLYDTVANVTEPQALEAAIKQVWASLWNARAVDERIHFGIQHRQVYPAVLIQTAVNASAAGVLLTTDIWGHQPRTYTINAKWGLGMRVVEGQKMAEQILFDSGNDGTRVISRADEATMLVADPKGGIIEKPVPPGAAILTEKRAKKLSEAAQALLNIFKDTEVLDIEWVLENKNGRDIFWIVQARPYVQAKSQRAKP